MEESIRGFLDWYLAPWRRVGRKEFGIGLTLATLPGLFIMVFGWGGSAGSFLGPLLDLAGGGDPLKMLNGLSGTPEAQGFMIDWTGVVNGLCLLAVVPLGRMRLRDMGWFGWQELALTAAFNVSVVFGLLESLTGYDILPMGMVWGIVNFAGYGWMTFAKSKHRPAVNERTTYKVADETAAPRKSDDEYY